jgi:hypothetical protein
VILHNEVDAKVSENIQTTTINRLNRLLAFELRIDKTKTKETISLGNI